MYIYSCLVHTQHVLMECLEVAFSVAKQQDAAQPHITAVNDNDNVI